MICVLFKGARIGDPFEIDEDVKEFAEESGATDLSGLNNLVKA